MSDLPPPPRRIDDDAARRFRDAAASAGFDDRAFQILGSAGPPGWKATMRGALRRLPSAGCIALARCFVLRDGLSRDELAPALGGADVLAAFERAGLVVPTSDGLVQCPFILHMSSAVMAFSDAIGDPPPIEQPDDYIIPIAASTKYVDDLAIRVPCGLAVDMGCGQGFLAMRSLSHARHCIATDVNPRATTFTDANASLNGVSGGIETRVGSFFEPLSDAMGKVDLFTFNPPFIITPEGHTASHSEGDGMLENVVRTMPGLLRDGGWATVIGIWEHTSSTDWVTRAQGWIANSGCDGLVLRFMSFQLNQYFLSSTPVELRAAAEPAWRAMCARRGIGALTYGAFIVRKRNGPNWFRSNTTAIDLRVGSASEHLRAYFATQTVVERDSSPAALLNLRLRTASGWRYDPGLPTSPTPPAGARGGLAFALPSAEHVEPALLAFEGTRPARQVLESLHATGQIHESAEHPESVGLVRSLILNGFLEIAE